MRETSENDCVFDCRPSSASGRGNFHKRSDRTRDGYGWRAPESLMGDVASHDRLGVCFRPSLISDLQKDEAQKPFPRLPSEFQLGDPCAVPRPLPLAGSWHSHFRKSPLARIGNMSPFARSAPTRSDGACWTLPSQSRH